jgi:hypothetical protein
MRVPVLVILSVAAIWTAAPASAQTYDPSYPVCLQYYDNEGSIIECGYNSLPQCAASAAGRSAQCITNPYFGGTRAPAGRRQRKAY